MASKYGKRTSHARGRGSKKLTAKEQAQEEALLAAKRARAAKKRREARAVAKKAAEEEEALLSAKRAKAAKKRREARAAAKKAAEEEEARLASNRAKAKKRREAHAAAKIAAEEEEARLAANRAKAAKKRREARAAAKKAAVAPVTPPKPKKRASSKVAQLRAENKRLQAQLAALQELQKALPKLQRTKKQAKALETLQTSTSEAHAQFIETQEPPPVLEVAPSNASERAQRRIRAANRRRFREIMAKARKANQMPSRAHVPRKIEAKRSEGEQRVITVERFLTLEDVGEIVVSAQNMALTMQERRSFWNTTISFSALGERLYGSGARVLDVSQIEDPDPADASFQTEGYDATGVFADEESMLTRLEGMLMDLASESRGIVYLHHVHIRHFDRKGGFG